MAVYCYERAGGISSTPGQSYSIGYVVHGTTDTILVADHIYNRSPPALVNGPVLLYRQPFEIKDQKGGVWHADVEYKPATDEEEKNDDQQAAPMAYKLSWDTGGGTARVTSSKEVMDAVGSPPERSTVIGWDGKKVNGVDQVVPNLVLQADVFYTPAFITQSDTVVQWSRATGKCNDHDWLGFLRGELLLLGNNGEQTFSMINGRSTMPVPVTFKIGASENIVPYKIEGGQLFPDLTSARGKFGWEYVDVYYGERKVGEAPNEITMAVPERFKIHRLYDWVDFRTVMGIG